MSMVHAAVVLFLTAVIATPAAAQFTPAPTDSTKRTPAPVIPKTPAGVALRAWLSAFNSGDSAQIAGYVQQYQPERAVDELVRFRKSTGGFALLSIERSDARYISFTLRREQNPTTVYGELTLSATEPSRADGPTLQALGPGISVDALKIEPTTQRHVIDRVVTLLDSLYVIPDVAQRAGDSLRARLNRGHYNGDVNGMTFTRRLNSELRVLTRDQHLEVLFSAMPFPPPPPAGSAQAPPSEAQRERARRDAAERNCGFQAVERLEGNVGYLKFYAFDEADLCEETVAAAMTFVANTRALVIDLRENSGGSPGMVTLIASYLFETGTHLNDLWTRHNDQRTEFWTHDSVAGRRFGSAKPVYVLTSARTFSAAEEFAYDLQALGRATIVGETTKGGAHPVRLRRIDDHFAAAIPHARAVNPVTRTNWEGLGVVPDVETPAREALAKVLELLSRPSMP